MKNIINKYYFKFIYIFVSIICSVYGERTQQISSSILYSENHGILPGEIITLNSKYFPKSTPKGKEEYYYVYTTPSAYLRIICDLEIKNATCEQPTIVFLQFLDEPETIKEYCMSQKVNLTYFEFFALNYLPGNGGHRFSCSINSELKDGNKIPDYMHLNYSIPDLVKSSNPVKTTCECGKVNKADAVARLINGQLINENEYTWMVALFTRMTTPFGVRDNYFCGGSLITNRHVLTAAHCELSKFYETYARVEAHYIIQPDDEKSIRIADRIPHGSYVPGKVQNDIAVLVLERDVEFGDFVGPACLPKQKENYVDQFVKITGWGTQFDGPQKYRKQFQSIFLQEIFTRILKLSECGNLFTTEHINMTHPKQLCHFNPKQDTCKGDSGGPLNLYDSTINKFKVVGVVSFGVDKCLYYKPKIATDVSFYINWIREKIAESTVPRKICVPP